MASDSSLANTQLLRLLEREQAWVRGQLLELEDDLHELEWRGLIRSARLRAESGELQLELLGARRWLIPPRDWADLSARLRAERLNWPSPGQPLRGQAPEQVFAVWTESWTEATRPGPTRPNSPRRRSVALTLPPTDEDLCALILSHFTRGAPRL